MTEFFVLYTDIVSKPRSGVIFVEKIIIKLINSVAVTFSFSPGVVFCSLGLRPEKTMIINH